MKWLFLLVFCFVLSTEGQTQEESTFTHKRKISLEIMNFGLSTNFREEVGTLNPDNRVAQLDGFKLGSYFRPNLTYKLSKDREILKLWVKPHFQLDNEPSFFFQELRTRISVYDDLYIMGGRYLKEIGTAVLINPSNPYVNNSGVINPKFLLKPMDFLELNYSKGNWIYAFIANLNEVDSPIYQEPLFEFKRSYSLFLEHFGESDNSGFILLFDEGKRFHLGGYKHQSINEAILLWADVSLSSNINRFYPIQGHWTDPSLLAYDMVSEDENNDLFLTSVIGGSFSFEDGTTIKVEYLFNQKGFNDDEFELYNDMIESSSQYNFDITKDLANINLGRGINTGMPFIRRNYLFTQLGKTDVLDVLNYNARYLYSFDDNSSQFSILLEYTKLEFMDPFILFVQNFGPTKSDLHRLVHSQFMFGINHKF